ncbi:glycoside hydrolase [Grosmannia clavigera kw1407]|uniref:beta-N-acetylhexosaminidase n=1 Tax=Grosmannia clavigera (strain kw1407 / UAMH 11150) TaxID=655863 RepID=F0XE20_GROCL|nr:glycoside hydrolase [Grosmannia clavigera kw1407]EFX04405.1 glycoside hydrolase [Grosmannia clavigera kw1407]
MMGSQLPHGIASVVAGVLFYSFINLFAVLVVIWLTWGHNERLTYVACLSYLVCLAIVASIIQQFHDALYWKDVVETQFKNLKLHPDNSQLVIANSPAGLDLGLFYIQFYVYNSASLLAMSWSIQLSQKVFGLAKSERSRRAFSQIDHFGKAFALAFPIITISCLSVKAVKKNRIGFIILADIPKGEYLDATGKQSSEAYKLITSPSGITIIGASPLGVWWGTRTILQQALLSLAESGVPSIPYGSGLDIPGWAIRGMMLDEGRHYHPPEFIIELCSYMSFFKQNTLQLHLSDNLYHNPNYTEEQSNELYARFRLWSEESAVAGLNLHANESYDRATFDTIQTKCASRGVTVIPEIEAPGHALVITQWKPELGLDTDSSQLNISHPEAIPTMKTIWETFLPWFHLKTVSIGADEYKGPEAAYNNFVNSMDGFIDNSTWTNVYQNVSVQHWYYGADNPYTDYILNNYSVVNSNDDFYVVNKWSHPGGYPNAVNLTRTFHGSPDGTYWRPNIFDQKNASDNPVLSSPYVLGSIVPLWNDYGANASVYSEAYYAWREGIPALADKQWGGNVSEANFTGLFAALQPKTPGQNLERTIPSKSDTIFNYELDGLRNSSFIPDSSPNNYTAHTTCTVGKDGSMTALAVSESRSVTTPLDSKGRNYTLSLSLRVDSLTDPTNATLLTGRDSILMLTPNITLFAGGNYFRLNATVPQGEWFRLDLVGRGNRTFAALNGGAEMQFLTIMGINGVYHHWAEIAIEAPLRKLGGSNCNWTGLFGGMSLKSTA